MVFCPECGNKNDEDSEYCVNCGSKLNKFHKPNKPERNESKKDRINRTTKVLIIVCIILVGGVGLTAGFLIQKESNSVSQYQITSPNTTEVQNQTYTPDWHEVATFTGPMNDSRDVTIKGDKFKVIISAVPSVTYTANDFRVDVFEGQGLVNNGAIHWDPTESPKEKEVLMEIPQGNGVYTIKMYNYDVESWEVKVYDYY
jgi:hypothetical protein